MTKKTLLIALTVFGLFLTFPLTQANANHCGSSRCWGAVGFGPNGARAFSHSYRQENSAYNRVYDECGGNCTIIKTFFNSCGAIASGPNGGWGWGYAPGRGRAERIAMDYCRKNTRGCRIRAWACSK